ncbi:MAG: hypothetical protein ACKOYQ_10230, partial [Actinomycetota bacterium]
MKTWPLIVPAAVLATLAATLVAPTVTSAVEPAGLLGGESQQPLLPEPPRYASVNGELHLKVTAT